MSGDQVLQNPLLSSEKPAEQTEINDILKKSRTPKNIIVKVNGLQIQSNLNPNALEFIPSNLQNKPQIQLNEELRKLILKDGLDGKFNQEKSFKKQEHFINDIELMQEPKNIESIENKQKSKNITRVEPIEENERTNKDNANEYEKIDKNIETNQLYMLFASHSEVKHTSSETEISEVNDSEPENTIIHIKENNLIHNESAIEVNDLNTEENNVLKMTDDINEILEVNPENVNKSNGNIEQCIISSTDKSNSGDDKELLELKSKKPLLYENVSELCEHRKPEVQNIKETHNAGIRNEILVNVNPENANNTNENLQETSFTYKKNTCLNENVLKTTDDIKEILEVNPENINKSNGNIEECISSTVKSNSGYDIEQLELKSKKPQLYENVSELCEHTKPKVQNIKESNNAGVRKTRTCGNPKNINISQEVKDPKTKLNVNSKIVAPQIHKTGTVKKTGLSTNPKNEVKERKELNTTVEARKEIKLKTPTTTLIQSTKLAKNFKNHLITTTTTNPKSHTLPANKLTLQTFKKDVINCANKDTISNRSSSSTDKSSPSIKSSTQGCKVKSNEKPKTKEYVPKSPRPTLSSKLRKTETQKRRNLFFDLDTIKMSDFLFK